MLPRAFFVLSILLYANAERQSATKQPKGFISCLPHLPGACGGLGGGGAGAARLLVSSAGG